MNNVAGDLNATQGLPLPFPEIPSLRCIFSHHKFWLDGFIAEDRVGWKLQQAGCTEGELSLQNLNATQGSATFYTPTQIVNLKDLIDIRPLTIVAKPEYHWRPRPNQNLLITSSGISPLLAL